MEPKKLTREQVEQIVGEARERKERPDLSGADLSGADLSRTDLRGAGLTGADLRGADLNRADLIGAELSEANLIGANLIGAYLNEADLSRAELSEANLSRAYLVGADLTRADLSRAPLSGANLSEANLSEANLSGASLSEANLSEANLVGADLREANLVGATFNKTQMDSTNFSNAYVGNTSFIKVDLSQVKGLTDVKHLGPSNLDLNTIYQSKDKIPAIFLEKAGVHPDIIRWQHSLHTRPTVFISYSHQDEKEKDELLVHLRALEREDLLTVWHDGLIGPGTDWKQGIKGAIAQASVVILLITPNFLASEFILAKEIPEFLERQKSEEGLIIFPIIAKPCAWSRVSWLEAIQLRPKGGKPIWGGNTNVDAELSKIADEVVEIIKDRWLRRD